MNTHADKTQENKSQAVANAVTQKSSIGEYTFQFVDNRPEAIAQRKLQETVNNSPKVKQLKALQEMANNSSRHIQRKIQLPERAYGNQDNNLSELKDQLQQNPIIESIENRVLPYLQQSIDQVLTRFDFQNRAFVNVDALAKAIAEELIENDSDVGEAIPKTIHHFWAGGKISKTAMKNIFNWRQKTVENSWNHLLWTDSRVNQVFESSNAEQMEALQIAGIQIIDLAQLPLGMGKDTQEAYDTLASKATSGQKSVLPFMSDLARYSALYHQGGVYADVDIDPNNVSLEKTLKHRDEESEIPMLGPGFRTEKDAQEAGYLKPDFGAKESASLSMFNKNAFGNHFIATRAGTNVMKQSASNATKGLQNSGFDVTSGPGDVLKAMHAQNSDLDTVSAQAIPPWLFDMNWVTDESSSIVN